MAYWLGKVGQPLHIDRAFLASHIAIEVERKSHGDHAKGKERNHDQKAEDIPHPPLPTRVVESGLSSDRVWVDDSMELSPQFTGIRMAVGVPLEAMDSTATLPYLCACQVWIE